MIENYELEKRGYFLYKFVEAMIKNSKYAEFYRLREILKEKNIIIDSKDPVPEKTIKEQVKEQLQKEKNNGEMMSSILRTPKEDLFQTRKNEGPLKIPLRKPLFQSKPKIKNIPSSGRLTNLEELEKISPLIKDSNVRIIEVKKKDEKVFVKGSMGYKPTRIILTEQEIDSIINYFSKVAKIPKNEGSLRIIYKGLLLDANVSSEKGSNFIIKKIG